MADTKTKAIVVVNGPNGVGSYWKYKPSSGTKADSWHNDGTFGLRIDTDGGAKNGSGTWQGSTSSGVASDKVPFIVIPGYRGSGNGNAKVDLGALGTKKASEWMGYLAKVKAPSGREVWGICGDVGWQEGSLNRYNAGGWGEVSIKMAWELGYKNASGNGNGGARGKFVITIYDKKLERGHRSPQDIQRAVKEIGGVMYSDDTNKTQEFIDEAKSHIGDGPSWTYKNSNGICTSGDWCGGFVTAVANKVGILGKLIYGSKSASEIVRQGVASGFGTFDKGPYHGKSAIPSAGDLVLFRYRDDVNYRRNDEYDANHIAIVTSVEKDNKTFTTAGGNEGGKSPEKNSVHKNTYQTSYKSIVGFYHPNWSLVGGGPPLSSGTYMYGPLFEKENTRQDAIIREVGYLDKKNEPSINVSDIKLSVINYTFLLGGIFDVVRQNTEFTVENEDEDDPNNYIPDEGVPSGKDTLYMLWPVPGYTTITSDFGVPRSSGPHSGIDIGTNHQTGKKVVAAEDGTVVLTKYLTTSYGHYIIIEHDKKTRSGKKVWTLYAHNTKILVKEGNHVNRGNQIATSGTTGNSSGPHLHFEVRLGSNRYRSVVDPKPYVRGHNK